MITVVQERLMQIHVIHQSLQESVGHRLEYASIQEILPDPVITLMKRQGTELHIIPIVTTEEVQSTDTNVIHHQQQEEIIIQTVSAYTTEVHQHPKAHTTAHLHQEHPVCAIPEQGTTSPTVQCQAAMTTRTVTIQVSRTFPLT